MGCSVEALLRLGATIHEAKREWKHGHYLEWLKIDLRLEPRKSQLIANVHERFGAHLEVAKNFEQTELYHLAAPCRKQVAQTLIESFRNGDKVTPEYKAKVLPQVKPKQKSIVSLQTKAACIESAVGALMNISADLRVILIQSWDAVSERDLYAFFDCYGLPVDRNARDVDEA